MLVLSIITITSILLNPSHAGCQNGGTELLILRLGDCTNNDFFSSTLKQTGLENENDPNANTYSIIGNLDKDDFVNPDGTYEFRLWYDNRYDHIGESNLRSLKGHS